MEAHGVILDLKFSCVDPYQISKTDLCISDVSKDLL